MLILSRYPGETIIFGDGDDKIEITVVNIIDGKTRIGINAPKTLPVYRKEIYDRMVSNGEVITSNAVKSESGNC